MKLSNTHSAFQAKIQRLADVSNIPTDSVFALWQEYSQNCQWADQSAILGEFVEWYGAKLGGNVQALRDAIGKAVTA